MVCKLPAGLKLTVDKYVRCRTTKDGNCHDILLHDTHLKHIGGGVHRSVYAYSDDCVIKFATGVNETPNWGRGGGPTKGVRGLTVKVTGRGANINEAAVYKTQPKLRPFLAPVDDYNKEGWWVTQRRVRNIGRGNVDTLIEELAKVGYYCTDINRGNFGTLDGKLVILDYGFGVQSCKFSPGLQHAVKRKVVAFTKIPGEEDKPPVKPVRRVRKVKLPSKFPTVSTAPPKQATLGMFR